MKRICPCCHQSFEFSLSSEDKMGNLLECSHCHSTLKWHEQALQVLHKSEQIVASVSSPVKEDIGVTEPKSASEKPNIESHIDESQTVAKNTDSENITTEENDKNTTPKKSSLTTEEVEESLDVIMDKESDLVVNDSNLVSQENIEGESSIESTENPTTENVSVENVNTPVTKQDLSDVEAYGNMESAAYKGLLRYDLQITGVDSSNVEEQILSILEDSRLKKDAKTCLSSKKNGVLQIKNLNPVKVVYLVSQLINLPIELSWKQYMAVNIMEEQDEGKVDLS